MHFFRNIFLARQAIMYGKILVNNKIIYKPAFLLRIGDLVSLNNKNYAWFLIYSDIFNFFKQCIFFKKRKKTSITSFFFPQYLEINFKILTGMLCQVPNALLVYHPSRMNIEYIRRSYF
jgi:ribosomal protein S4